MRNCTIAHSGGTSHPVTPALGGDERLEGKNILKMMVSRAAAAKNVK